MGGVDLTVGLLPEHMSGVDVSLAALRWKNAMINNVSSYLGPDLSMCAVNRCFQCTDSVEEDVAMIESISSTLTVPSAR